VAYEVWGPALRGAPAELIDRVLADLPEGPRQMVRDLAATPQPREKINEARSKILDALSAFAAKGEVDLGRPAEGSELV
jgi:flagellar motor switch protein FliG